MAKNFWAKIAATKSNRLRPIKMEMDKSEWIRFMWTEMDDIFAKIATATATVAETMIASIGLIYEIRHRHHNNFNIFSNSIKYVPCLIR